MSAQLQDVGHEIAGTGAGGTGETTTESIVAAVKLRRIVRADGKASERVRAEIQRDRRAGYREPRIPVARTKCLGRARAVGDPEVGGDGAGGVGDSTAEAPLLARSST